MQKLMQDEKEAERQKVYNMHVHLIQKTCWI